MDSDYMRRRSDEMFEELSEEKDGILDDLSLGLSDFMDGFIDGDAVLEGMREKVARLREIVEAVEDMRAGMEDEDNFGFGARRDAALGW